MPEPKAVKPPEDIGAACGDAWLDLATANEALDAAKSTGSASLYRAALDLTVRREEAYHRALLAWWEEMSD